MVFLIILICVVGFILFVNYISKGINEGMKEIDENRKNSLDELLAEHGENYEKWEKEYYDFFKSVGQCYKYDTKERKECKYPHMDSLYSAYGNTNTMFWADCIPEETKDKYGLFFISFFHHGEVAYNNDEIVVFTIYNNIFVRENDSNDTMYSIDSKENSNYIDSKVAIILKVLYDKDGNYKPYEPRRYKISDIRYFKECGGIETLANISGGGGGGYDIGGAIVGGLIAGDAGAIIGSRKEIEPIKTTYETNDNRRTYIFFNDGRNITISGHSMYEWLMGIVPEKEYNSYIQRISQQQTNQPISQQTVNSIPTPQSVNQPITQQPLNQMTGNIINNTDNKAHVSNQQAIMVQQYKCSKCGNIIKGDDVFCSKCGSQLVHEKSL